MQNFVLQKVSTNFVLKELSKLKVTKVSGPDGITARLLKDAADQLLLNQSCIWLTLLFQQDLFKPSGRRHGKHLFQGQCAGGGVGGARAPPLFEK